MEQKRQYNLDLLRILACFMVLILHTAAQRWESTPPESFAWQIFNIYDVLVRSAVPLFFMMSGKLFLARDDISLKKLFSKNLLKLILIYFLWSFFYALDTVGIKGIITSRNFSSVFTVAINSKYHLWYLPSLISVYLLIPILMGLKSYKNGKILNYIAVLFFVFSIARYSILLLPVGQGIKDILQKFDFVFDQYSGYFLLGYILDKYKDKLSKIPSFVLMLVYLVTVTVTALGSYLLSLRAGSPVKILYNNFFISSFVEAVVIFTLFLRLSNINLNKNAGTIIEKTSAYTLFVYLIHPFIIEHLDAWFGLDTLSFHPIISVPAISVILFASSVGIAFILDKIPVVRKILL